MLRTGKVAKIKDGLCWAAGGDGHQLEGSLLKLEGGNHVAGTTGGVTEWRPEVRRNQGFSAPRSRRTGGNSRGPVPCHIEGRSLVEGHDLPEVIEVPGLEGVRKRQHSGMVSDPTTFAFRANSIN